MCIRTHVYIILLFLLLYVNYHAFVRQFDDSVGQKSQAYEMFIHNKYD